MMRIAARKPLSTV
jgi:hypothetical protein